MKSFNESGPVARLACAATLALAAASGRVYAQDNAQPDARPAAPAESKAERQFDVPASSLATALARFGEQAGLQLVYESKAVQNLTARGVQGRMSTEAALSRLLEGLPVGFRYLETGAVTIEPRPAGSARVLGPVRVEGAQQDRPHRGEGVAQLGGIRGGQDQEARGYRPVVASVGVSAPTAIEDIARSVSVLTQKQIEKQDINDIGEALRRLPGVTMLEQADNTAGGSRIVSRGLLLQKVQVDGGAAQQLSVIDNGMLGIGAYERIELVRGPNGAFVGDGSPGGSLNLVRKRPGMAESLTTTAIAGSWNRRQIGIDYSTPSVGGSPFAFRGNATWQDQEFFHDITERKNWLLYGIFDAPLGEQARLELGFQHTDDAEKGSYNGIPRYVEGPLIDLPRSYNFATERAYTNSTFNEVFGRFHMNLPRNWNFEVGVEYNTRDLDLVNMQTGTFWLSQETNAVPKSRVASTATLRQYIQKSNFLGTHFSIAGQERTFGIDHNLSIRGQFSEASTPLNRNRFGAAKAFPTVADLDMRVFPDTPYVDWNLSNPTSSIKTAAGLTLADTISWRDRIDLNLAIRRSESSDKRLGRQMETIPTNPRYGQLRFIDYEALRKGIQGTRMAYWEPSWSVVLKPLRGLSIYGDLSSGTEPQDDRFTVDQQAIGPLTYDNKELGVKYGTAGWVASLNVYDMFKTNVAAIMAGTQGNCPPTPTSYCYFLQGNSIKSKGVDLEFGGEILDGLSASASYNYNSTELIPGINDIREKFTQAPSRMAKLLVDWTLPFMRTTSVSLNATYQSSTFQAGTRSFYDPVTGVLIPPTIPYEFTEPSWVVVDFGVNHAFSRELSLNLFVENITDREYLSTVSNTLNFMGKPRSITATMRWNPRGDAPGSGRSPTTGMAPFGDPSQWYGSFELGRHEMDTLTGTSTGLRSDGTPVVLDFELQPNAVSSARLGYRFDSHWRVEAEGGFRASKFGRISGAGPGTVAVCHPIYTSSSSSSAPVDCNDAAGEANAWSLMFNGLHDFRAETARVRPFVGLGVGVSRWSIDFGTVMKGIASGDPVSSTPVETLASVDQHYALSWQAMTGAAIRWTDRAYVTAAYSFFNSRKVRWDTDHTPSITPTIGAFEADVEDHAFTLGIQWFFGDRP